MPEPMLDRRLYHFTCREHLDSILSEGVLRVTNPNLTRRHDGPGVVWLLDTPTVDRPHGLGRGGVIPGTKIWTVDKTAIRVSVEVPDASPWVRWVQQRRHDPAWFQTMILTGGGQNAARHWYVVMRLIPRAEWVEVRDMQTDVILWQPEPEAVPAYP